MKSSAYRKVSILIKAGEIKDFQQIAIDVQKKVLATDMGMHFRTLTARVKDPGKWLVRELVFLANLLEIEPEILFKMAERLAKEVDELEAKKKKRGKK